MPLFSYFGGKNRASEWIYKQIPKNILENCKTFTEVFSGAYWVYANNDWSHVDNIIYNDMNLYLTNFMKCATIPDFLETLEKFYEPGGLFYYDKTISTDQKVVYDFNYDRFKTDFYKLRKELYDDTDGQDIEFDMPDFDMAIKYAFMLRHAFSGIPSKKMGYSYSAASYKEGKKTPEPKSQILLRKLNDDAIMNKLKAVTNFEALDFEEHIKKHDSPNTIFYVDPPYFNCEKNYYRGDEYFGKSGHERLANVLNNIQGKFILSYYNFDDLHNFYPQDKYHWISKEFTKATTSIAKNGSQKGEELLIMNFEPASKLAMEELLNNEENKKNTEDFWE